MNFIKRRLIEDISAIRVYHPDKQMQIYDLSLMTQGYYRIIIAANMQEGTIQVKSNIKEINGKDLFDFETDDEALASMLVQADFLFANFIFMELYRQNIEAKIACQYVDIDYYVQGMEDLKTKYLLKTKNFEHSLDTSESFEYLLDSLEGSHKVNFENEMINYNKLIDDIFVGAIFDNDKVLS